MTWQRQRTEVVGWSPLKSACPVTDLMTVLHLAEISLADESSKCLWLVLMKTVVLKFPRCSLFSAAKSCLSLTSEYDRDVTIK